MCILCEVKHLTNQPASSETCECGGPGKLLTHDVLQDKTVLVSLRCEACGFEWQTVVAKTQPKTDTLKAVLDTVGD